MLDVGQELVRGARRWILSRLPPALAPETSLLGIDIGSEYVKVVECRAQPSHLDVRTALCFHTPSNSVSGHAVQDIDAVAQAVRANLDRAHVRSGRAIAAIPGQSAMVKRFDIGAADIARLDELVRSEVENLVPAASGTLCVDYQVHERPDEEGIEVIVVTARSELVADYARILERAGLAPEAIDVDCLALANLFEANCGFGTSSTVAQVHVGARFASLIIHSHGRTMFAGDVPAGTEGMRGGRHRDGEGFAAEVAAEIDRSLRFYWPLSAGDRIDEILLTGGAAREQPFVEALAACTGCGVRVVDPFACMRQDGLSDAEGGRAQFAIAAGLAARLRQKA
jgi:type IV pilus assembly protein PilM